MKEKIYVFISSKMQELSTERQRLAEFIPQIEFTGFEFHPWIFEQDALPESKSIREVYLGALNNSMVYIGLFWNQYGEWTIDEFNHATNRNIERHIYVKDIDAHQRDPQLTEFLSKWGDVTTGITSKWFKSTDDLLKTVQNALIKWIEWYLLHQPSSREAQLFNKTTSIPPHNTVIGRDQLQQTILGYLGAGEPVLLQGMGGMGKTVLSYAVLQQWIDTGKNALWLKAGSAGTQNIFEVIVKRLEAESLKEIVSGDLEKQQQVIRDILLKHHIELLVLDNVWNGQALADVIGALPPHMPLLATARQRYPLYHIVPMSELSDHDALVTLQHYAGADFPDERQKMAAKELCRLLGNHPMALELAGINLKVQMDVPRPTILLKEIKDAPHDMKSPDSYTSHERHTIKELLDTSLHAIDKDSRAVFLACGTFYVPQISEELLRIYLDNPPSLGDCLKRLLTSGLLKVTYGEEDDIAVYHLHDLAYSYARAQATPQDKDRAQKACLTFTQQHEANSTYLNIELSNLLGASRTAYVQKQPDILINIMQILVAKGYMDEYGHTLPLLARLDEAIEVARAMRDVYLEALHYLLGKRANAYYERGELDKAAQYYLETAQTGELLGLEIRHFRASCLVNAMYSEMGKIEIAENGLRALEAIARAKNSDALLVIVLESWAFHYERHDNYLMCRQYAMEEVAVVRRTDNAPTPLFHGLVNWGIAEKFLNNPHKSKELLEEALTIGREYEMEQWQAQALHALAETWIDLGDLSQALGCSQQALALFEAHGFTARKGDVEKLIVKIKALGGTT